MDSIITVREGRYYVSSLSAEKTGAIPFDRQKTREEVLQLVAEGKSMKEIAGILGISVQTVEFHENNIVRQLGLHTTAELMRYALDHGIVSV